MTHFVSETTHPFWECTNRFIKFSYTCLHMKYQQNNDQIIIEINDITYSRWNSISQYHKNNAIVLSSKISMDLIYHILQVVIFVYS